jgi:hypothetical protein
MIYRQMKRFRFTVKVFGSHPEGGALSILCTDRLPISGLCSPNPSTVAFDKATLHIPEVTETGLLSKDLCN